MAQGGKVPQEQLLGILKQVVAGLNYAHRHGVVHRDMKPGNILLQKVEGGNSKPEIRAKISDFGLVRLVGEEWVRSQATISVQRSVSMGDKDTLKPDEDEGTSTRALLGTFEYMSPEQKRGEEADARSDLYSVGLMAFKLLTGRNPGLKPPSQVDPKLAQAWDAMTLALLEEDAAERPATAGAVLEMLGNVDREIQRKEREVRENEAQREAEARAAQEREQERIAQERRRLADEKEREQRRQAEEELRRKKEAEERQRADKQKATPPSKSIHAGAWGVLVVLVVAGAGWWAWNKVGDRETPQQRPAPAPAAAFPPTDVVTVKSATEVKWETAQKLDRRQGFGATIDDVAVLLRAADAFFKEKDYVLAHAKYQAAETECARLLALDKERQAATGVRSQAMNAQTTAKAAGSAQDAPMMWQNAELLMTEASAAFETAHFADAQHNWETAAQEYEKADSQAVQVQAEKEKQRLAEEQRKQDEFSRQERARKDDLAVKQKQQELRKASGPKEGKNWTSPTTGMEFVWISALKIWVGKYEVTNGEYRKYKSGHDSQSSEGQSLNGDNQPTVYVNFDDAKEYGAWLARQDGNELNGASYRLPSEDEWMVFAQCGDGREYPWGNNWPPQSGQAGNYADATAKQVFGGWSCIESYDDGHAVTCNVEDSWKNPWGLYGVGGNVWEATASDKSGASFGAWLGASWDFEDSDYLRCSNRLDIGGSQQNHYRGGFRLVLSLEEDKVLRQQKEVSRQDQKVQTVESRMGKAHQQEKEVQRHAQEVQALKSLESGYKLLTDGNYEEAIKSFEDARSNLPERPATFEQREQARWGLAEAQYRVAWDIYRQKGNMIDARNYAEQSLKNDPEHKGVTELLEKIAPEQYRQDLPTRPARWGNW